MRVCSNCGSNNTRINEGKYEQWYKYNGNYLCNNCHAKLWNRNNPDRVKFNSSRRINPRGKGNIVVAVNPRKGICSWCGRQGLTDIHHIEYNEDPLKDTIELCRSCHSKETRKSHPIQRDLKTGRFISKTRTSTDQRVVGS